GGLARRASRDLVVVLQPRGERAPTPLPRGALVTVPALAIAAYVADQGAVYSEELLEHFELSESSLRRRRPALRRLGIEFVRHGRWSFYATAETLARFPTARRPVA